MPKASSTASGAASVPSRCAWRAARACPACSSSSARRTRPRPGGDRPGGEARPADARVVVGAQVHDHVLPRPVGALTADDQDGRGLAPPQIPALGLGGVERRQEPRRPVALGAVVGVEHGQPDRVPPHEVGLHADPGLAHVPGGGDAVRPRVGGRPARGVDHGHLAAVGAGVGRQAPPPGPPPQMPHRACAPRRAGRSSRSRMPAWPPRPRPPRPRGPGRPGKWPTARPRRGRPSRRPAPRWSTSRGRS